METCFRKLNKILKQNVRTRAKDNRTSSFKTRKNRYHALKLAFSQLHSMGYKITDPTNIKPHHISALVEYWENTCDYTPQWTQAMLSYVRVFCGWINKPGMVKPVLHYTKNPQRYAQEKRATKIDKGWISKGVDPLKIITTIQTSDEKHAQLIGLGLKMQLAFGLRAKESWMIKPHVADRELYLELTDGTKGGRPRTIPIDSDFKREVLDEAKSILSKPNERIFPPNNTYSGWQTHYYRVLRKYGLSKETGLVTHGLRHDYANDRYQQFSGGESPVREKTAENRPLVESEKYARDKILPELGHARPVITNAYLGSYTPKKGSNELVD